MVLCFWPPAGRLVKPGILARFIAGFETASDLIGCECKRPTNTYLLTGAKCANAEVCSNSFEGARHDHPVPSKPLSAVSIGGAGAFGRRAAAQPAPARPTALLRRRLTGARPLRLLRLDRGSEMAVGRSGEESPVRESCREADTVCVRILDSATSWLPRPWRTVGDVLLVVVVAIGVVLTLEVEVATPLSVTTSSMEPTLHCARPVEGCEARLSDRVIVCKICYAFSGPERNQLVAFRAPAAATRICGEGDVYVKRLIAFSGETVHEDQQGRISIDGHRLNEPYLSAANRLGDDSHRGQTWHVSANAYFMLGDNRGASCDSRLWGDVPRSSLIGPLLLTYWPPTRIAFDG
jgi:signal peptidase I